jgi:hypothetical protein
LDSLNSTYSLGQSTFRQVLPTTTHLTVTTINSPATLPLNSPSSPSNSPSSNTDASESSPDSQSTQKDVQTTIHTVKSKDSSATHESRFGETLEKETIFDVTSFAGSLRDNFPEKECNGDYLGCLSMLHDIAPSYTGKFNFIYTDGYIISFLFFLNLFLFLSLF